MKIFIPELGTQLKLTKAQEFLIAFEYRNESIFKVFFPHLFAQRQAAEEKRKKERENCWKPIKSFYGGREWAGDTPEYKKACNEFDYICSQFPKEKKFKFTKGTIFEVDRIYIRQGNSYHSSVTFKIRLEKRVLRFWLPLSEVNTIECEIVGNPSEARKKNISRNSIGG